MPQIKEYPKALSPYIFHKLGLAFSGNEGDEALADCPFCGREGKFSVNSGTGLWKCFICGEDGNAYSFIRKFLEDCEKSTSGYESLAANRNLLDAQSLVTWRICKSITSNNWLVPGYGIDRSVNQLYSYAKVENRNLLLLTPTLGHQLFGLGVTFDPSKPNILICEGIWDTICLWEVFSQVKKTNNGLAITANPSMSLLSDTNIIGVPGCGVFFDKWSPLFSGKNVTLLYDNDHDRKHPKTGKIIPSAGYEGMKRTCGILSSSEKPPANISYLEWCPGARYDSKLPSGYDLRDALTKSGGSIGHVIKALETILSKIKPAPKEWLIRDARGLKSEVKQDLELIPCSKYSDLAMTCRKAMKWTTGLDGGLSIMLASIVSTTQVGDQLWVKIYGPASCGKSTLCEAVSSCKKYVHAVSTLNGFYSGYMNGEAGGEDHSLIAKLIGKTLVTKDGDTILKAPNREQILSEARDIYDTVSRTSFKNKASKEYTGVRMTWILCGTAALRELDASELGARFLDYVIMEGIDDELEDEILWRVANREERNVSIQVDEKVESQQSPAMTLMMKTTGGYIKYLRENASSLYKGVEMSEDAMKKCTVMAKFIAHMRARPARRQDEIVEREFAARLVSQLIRLSKSLAVVLNRRSVDEVVMERVKKVVMDTSRGVTLRIFQRMFEAGTKGISIGGLAHLVDLTDDKVRYLLRFLKLLGVVSNYQINSGGVRGHIKWRVTSKLAKIYENIMGETYEDTLEDD